MVPRVIKSFPDIRIALSEGGTGWIPYFLDRVDRTYDMHHRWTGQNFGGRLPSDVFRQHFLTCFISDPIGVQLRHQIGIDNIAWECDYPHSDSSWPYAPEELARWRSASLTMRWKRSPGAMPAAGIPSIRWPIGPGSGARWPRCGRSGRSRRVNPFVRHGRIERSGQGVDLGVLAANATA